MKPYRDQLLALVRALTDADQGHMELMRLGPSTNPDPIQTSYNETVQWRIKLWFGRGYFQGALVWFQGRWNSPHANAGDGGYFYAEMEKDFPLEGAVDLFLSDTIPGWALPKVAKSGTAGKILCPDCNGTGWLNGVPPQLPACEPSYCQRCGGTGKIAPARAAAAEGGK